MIAAGILDISVNLLLVLQVIVCLLLALLVLMQRPKNEGLGAAFGSGMTDSILGAGTTNVLQKGTVYLGVLFFSVTLILSILIGQQNANPNIAADPTATPAIPTGEAIVDPEEEEAESEEVENAPAVDLSEELKEVETTVAEETAPEASVTEEAPAPAETTPAEEPATPEEEPKPQQ